MSDQQARWAGRNETKDQVRDDVWNALVDTGVNVGPSHSRIPNFTGADQAALNLAQVPAWKAARVVKCNPDPPQIPVRLRALYEGKTVYAPVPELLKPFPFVKLDPKVLEAKGITFELAATSQGFVEHGEPVEFEDMEPLDIVVVGCVAVTRAGGRTGKGGGFADLELGIFRELGKVGPDTQIVTTVHSSQVVADDRVIMVAHDSALHWIATEGELIETRTQMPQPTGVAWDHVEADQYRDIPFLQTLRSRITGTASEPSPSAAAYVTEPAGDEIAVAAVGAHMSGLPLNGELTKLGARLLKPARTAPGYRLYSLAGGPPFRPGLMRDPSGASIALEVWALPKTQVGTFLSGIPAPLGLGTITLDDGSQVKGFICEQAGLEGARDITKFGGWRAFLEAREVESPAVS